MFTTILYSTYHLFLFESICGSMNTFADTNSDTVSLSYKFDFGHPVGNRSKQLRGVRGIALERRVAAAKRCHKVNRMHNLDVGNYCTYVPIARRSKHTCTVDLERTIVLGKNPLLWAYLFFSSSAISFFSDSAFCLLFFHSVERMEGSRFISLFRKKLEEFLVEC